jgi:hypothetical protein
MDGNSYKLVKCCATCAMFVKGGFCDTDGVLKGLSPEELTNSCYEYSTDYYGLCDDYNSSGEVELYDEYLEACEHKRNGNAEPYITFMTKLTIANSL